MMDLPSGRKYSDADLALLAKMNDRGSIKYSDEGFELKSGKQSNVYVFLRGDVTDSPELGWMLGRNLAQTIVACHQDGDGQPCMIGIPTAATGLAAATSLVSYQESIVSPAGPIIYRVMREAVKSHGAGATNWVNGKYDDRFTFWAIDNVVTNGDSKFEAADRLTASGYPALEMPSLVVVDRQQGGIERMQAHGFKRIEVVFNLLDIAYAMGERGLWPKSVVKSVEDEIVAHQFE